MKHYVLDACAMVAMLKRENGADAVDDLFQQAVRGDALLYELETIANKEMLNFLWFR